MRSTSVICLLCKELVPVIDKTIQRHGECPAGGMRYVPSPMGFKRGAGGPSFELLATRPATIACGCGSEHQGIAAIFRATVPDPTVN